MVSHSLPQLTINRSIIDGVFVLELCFFPDRRAGKLFQNEKHLEATELIFLKKNNVGMVHLKALKLVFDVIEI